MADKQFQVTTVREVNGTQSEDLFGFTFSSVATVGGYTTITAQLTELEANLLQARTFRLHIAATTQAAPTDLGTFVHSTNQAGSIWATNTADCDYLCQTNSSGQFVFMYGSSGVTFVTRTIIGDKAFESSSFVTA